MGYRVLVDKPVEIRAITSGTNISVTDIQLQKSSIFVSKPTYEVTLNSQKINAFTSFVNLIPSISFQNLVASDVLLDPFTLNQYPVDSITFSDLPALLSEKGITDAFPIAEILTLSSNKGVDDNVTMSEDLQKSLTFFRTFSDVFTLDDFATVGGVRKDTQSDKTNVVGFVDAQALSTSKVFTDSIFVTEASTLTTDEGRDETLGVNDVFQRVVTFSRAFSDTPSISEDLASSLAKSQDDSFSIAEQAVISFAFDFSDAVSFASNAVTAFNKGIFDSTTVTESINVKLTAEASSVLNAGALNFAPLNN